MSNVLNFLQQQMMGGGSGDYDVQSSSQIITTNLRTVIYRLDALPVVQLTASKCLKVYNHDSDTGKIIIKIFKIFKVLITF